MALGAGGVACCHDESFLVDEVAVPKLQTLLVIDGRASVGKRTETGNSSKQLICQEFIDR